jgi:hypothetical protein
MSGFRGNGRRWRACIDCVWNGGVLWRSLVGLLDKSIEIRGPLYGSQKVIGTFGVLGRQK